MNMKNEIVARFMGVPDSAAPYDDSYDWLMPAWVKFRDLKFEGVYFNQDHRNIRAKIGYTIVYGTITEAFDELVKGIQWYESLSV